MMERAPYVSSAARLSTSGTQSVSRLDAAAMSFVNSLEEKGKISVIDASGKAVEKIEDAGWARLRKLGVVLNEMDRSGLSASSDKAVNDRMMRLGKEIVSSAESAKAGFDAKNAKDVSAAYGRMSTASKELSNFLHHPSLHPEFKDLLHAKPVNQVAQAANSVIRMDGVMAGMKVVAKNARHPVAALAALAAGGVAMAAESSPDAASVAARIASGDKTLKKFSSIVKPD